MDKYTQKKQGLYEKYVKRGFDIVCSCLALFCLAVWDCGSFGADEVRFACFVYTASSGDDGF